MVVVSGEISSFAQEEETTGLADLELQQTGNAKKMATIDPIGILAILNHNFFIKKKERKKNRKNHQKVNKNKYFFLRGGG
jgi:hypothetical protein